MTQASTKVRLIGQELYRIEDELGTILVSERGNKRLLSFGSLLEQSCLLLNKPYYLMHEYTQTMLLGLLFAEAQRITILGLGGGAFVHCLSHYFPHLTIQAIEIRKAVIDIAYEWFNLPNHDNLTVINADANEYVSTLTPNSSDIIFSDLYEADGMSACQAQEDFLSSSCLALSEPGCLVLNLHQLPSRDSKLLKTLERLFCEIVIYDAGESIEQTR